MGSQKMKKTKKDLTRKDETTKELLARRIASREEGCCASFQAGLSSFYPKCLSLAATLSSHADRKAIPLSGLDWTKKDLRLARRSNISFFKNLAGPPHFLAKFERNWGSKYGSLLLCVRATIPLPLRLYFDVLFPLTPPKFIGEQGFFDYLDAIKLMAISSVMIYGIRDALFFCDIDNVLGYDVIKHREYPKVVSEWREKVATDSPLTATQRSSLCHIIDKIISEIVVIEADKFVTYSSFVHFRDLWTLQGASTIGKKLLLSTPKDTRMGGKWASTLALSDQKLMDITLGQKDGNIISPFQKMDEPAKARIVINYDTRSYIRLSYLSYFIKSFSRGAPWTTAGLNSCDKWGVRKAIQKEVLDPNTILVSLDQRKFDYNQDGPLIRYIVSRLFDKVISALPPSKVADLKRIKEIELACMDKQRVLEPGRKAWSPKKGVFSGHRFTLLIDSILNRAEAEYVHSKMNIVVKRGFYQGDDALLSIVRPSAPHTYKQTLMAEYGKLGLDCHPLKTFTSPNMADFLHELYTGSEVLAMPLRLLKSILWRRPPTLVDFVPSDQLLRNDLDHARKAVRRGLINIYPYLTQLLARKKLVGPKVGEWFLTPLPFGGFGGGKTGRISLDIVLEEPPSAKLSIKTDLTPSLPPGMPYSSYLSLIQERALSVFPRTGVTVKARLSRVKGVDSPPTLLRNFASGPKLKMCWNVFDKVPDPWLYDCMRKAGLRDYSIPSFYVPDPLVRYLPHPWAKLSKIQSLYTNSFFLETTDVASDAYSSIAKLANDMWGGLLARCVLYNLKIETTTLWNQLVASFFRTALNNSFSLSVRV